MAMMRLGTTWKESGKRPAVALFSEPSEETSILTLVRTLEVRVGVEAAEPDPLSSEEPPGQHELQQAAQLATVFRGGDLGAIHWNDTAQNADGDTSNRTAHGEHSQVDRTTLESAAECRDDCA
jgi:hypothetical protein